MVIELSATLDRTTGRLLVDAVTCAVAARPERLDIDLRAVTAWTCEGAAALVRCREICRDLPQGLHYRSGRGPGRDALLAAYT